MALSEIWVKPDCRHKQESRIQGRRASDFPHKSLASLPSTSIVPAPTICYPTLVNSKPTVASSHSNRHPSIYHLNQLTHSHLKSSTTANMHASAVVAFAFAAVAFAQVSQLGDGQPQAPTSVAAPVSEFTDGQPQVTVAASSYVSACPASIVETYLSLAAISTTLFLALTHPEISIQAC